MTELEHVQLGLLRKEALTAKIGIRYGSRMFCWIPTKWNNSKHEQNM